MPEEKIVLGFEGHRVEHKVWRGSDVPTDEAAKALPRIPEGEPRPWDLDTKFEVLQKSHSRVDGMVKATGAARYTHDVRLPGMLWGVLLRSPHAAARIKKIDVEPAKRCPGVKAAITIPKGEVHFHGDEVAAVCAVTLDQARDALAAIVVEYEVVPCVATVEDALKPGAPRVFAKRDNAMLGRTDKHGDAEAALKAGDAVVSATYRTQVQTHSALETSGVVAQWETDGSLTVHASTQGTFSVRDQLTAHFKIPPSQCRILSEHVGGGFGAKFNAGVEGVAAATLAREAKAPVWLMVDRKGHHLACGNRPDSIQDMQGAITKDGTITALTVKSVGTGGVAGGAGVANPKIYAVANTTKLETHVFTNAGGARSFRAPGNPQGSFALEQMVDELALAVGLDPLAVRLKNDKSLIRQPEWKLGAEAIGWAERRNKTPGKGGVVLRGIGCAATSWGGHGGPGASVLVRVDADGAVEVRSGAQDIGTGTRTVLACVVAEELGLEGPQQVKVAMGDTRDPVGPGSGGSRTASTIAPAARAAAAQVKAQLWAALSKGGLDAGASGGGGKAKKAVVEAASVTSVEASPEGQLKGGKVRIHEAAGWKWVTFADAVKISGKKSYEAIGRRAENYVGAGFHEGGVAGCQFAEVEVDTETGRIRVIKVVAVQDMGTIVDRLTAESQIIGGVIQGVGYALFEERILDRKTGRDAQRRLPQLQDTEPRRLPRDRADPLPRRLGPEQRGPHGPGRAAHDPDGGSDRQRLRQRHGRPRPRDPHDSPARPRGARGGQVRARDGRRGPGAGRTPAGRRAQESVAVSS